MQNKQTKQQQPQNHKLRYMVYKAYENNRC